MSWRRRRLRAVLATMLLLPATATAGAATTDGPATVAVLPLHERAVDITLIGASTQGVAVLAAGVSRQSEEMVWTGDWDGPLTARPQVRTAEGFRAYFRELGVFGDTLAWGRVRSGSMSSGTALYRTDLVSGRTSLDGWVSGVTSVLTEQGMDQTWISSSDPWSELPPYRQGLVRSPVTTAPGSDADWPQESDLWRPGPGRELDSWTADDAGAVVVTRRAVDDEPLTDGDTDGDAELVEVPLDGGPARTVLAAGSVRSDDVEHMEAGAGTIVWAREAYGGRAGAVWTMPRAGGPVTAQVEDDPRAELSTLSVSALGTVGYLVRGPAGRRTLRTIADGVVRDLPLPVGSSGLTAVGADFVTATGRGPQPGVYRIRPGAEPVLDVGFAPARYPIGGWDLAAGRLFYADRSAGGARRLPLFSRAVDAVPALGPQEQQQAWAGAAADAPGAMPMSFSAGRAVLGSPSANLLWDVLDRGRRTVSVEQEPLPGRGTAFPSITDPVMSGPYLLLGRQVHRSDGSLLHRLPVAVARTGRADLFGPTVVYATHLRGRGRVWLFDVENGRRQRVSDVACTHAPQVAIWGRTLAWADCDAAQVRVRDLVTGATRRIATGIDPATAPARIHLSLGEGSLAWVAGGQAVVVDLSRPGSEPVALAGTTRSLALDGILVARLVKARAPVADLRVERLPFEVASHPRLTGVVATLGFTPDGDGRADVWAPQFDTTEPLAEVSLRIVSSRFGRLVRSFAPSDSSDGSVRGIVWDGTTAAGRTVPQGYYTWTLTGRSVSGAPLTTATGGGAISGTIELTRPAGTGAR